MTEKLWFESWQNMRLLSSKAPRLVQRPTQRTLQPVPQKWNIFHVCQRMLLCHVCKMNVFIIFYLLCKLISVTRINYCIVLDMTFTHDGNKTYVEGLINFEKMHMLAQTMRTIRYCRSRHLGKLHYKISSCMYIWFFFWVLFAIPDNTLQCVINQTKN
jgi:hypothetical protein